MFFRGDIANYLPSLWLRPQAALGCKETRLPRDGTRLLQPGKVFHARPNRLPRSLRGAGQFDLIVGYKTAD